MSDSNERGLTRETHQENFVANRARELFSFINADGELESKTYEVLQFIDKELQNESWYLGLNLFGSRILGHAAKDSDIDVYVCVKYSGNFQGANNEAIDDTFALLKALIKQKFNLDVELLRAIVPTCVNEVGINPGNNDPLELRYVVDQLEMLIWWSTEGGKGGKIQKSRELFRNYLTKFDATARGLIKLALLQLLKDKVEEKRGDVRNSRIPPYGNLSTTEREEILRKRMILWEERINSLYGLQ